MAGEHGELAVGRAGPLVRRAIPVEFDAVVVGVAEVEGFADAVVGGAVEFDACLEQTTEGVSELGAGGVDNGDVVKAGRAGRRWRAASAFPGVESNMMMIAAGGKEGGLVAEALGNFEAQDAMVKFQCAIEVCDLQVDMADSSGGIDGVNRACWLHVLI